MGRRDRTPPASTAIVTPAPNRQGWVHDPPSVVLSAIDEGGGSGVASISYSLTSARSIANQMVSGAGATIAITNEGTTTLTYHATDRAGNVEAADSLTVRYDGTPPGCKVVMTPGSIRPPRQQDGGH
jgi:hypothetical protein